MVINPLIPHMRPGYKAADFGPASQLVRAEFSSQKIPSCATKTAGVACLVCRGVLGPAPPGCRCLCSITALLEVRSCHHHRAMCYRPAEAGNVSVPPFLILRICGNNPVVNISICMAEPCRRELSCFCRVVCCLRMEDQMRVVQTQSEAVHLLTNEKYNQDTSSIRGHFHSRPRGHGTGGGVAVSCRPSWGLR